jgi:Major Facilitator Superfamily
MLRALSHRALQYSAAVVGPDVAHLYVWWKSVFASFHRGYWLVASLYLVLDANLSAFQLVIIGVVQSVVAVACEVPAGVMADAVSRKWSLVVAHMLMGTAIVITGTVTSFPALVATQALWGLAWTFVSGADVAWVTDEIDDASRIDRVLTDAARWEAVGSAGGLVVFGALAWAADRGTAIIGAGISIIVIGLVVAVHFPERRFQRLTGSRWQASRVILQSGMSLARRDREIMLVFVATFLVNGAGEMFGRVYAKRLVALGLPNEPDPIVWYTLLGLAMLLSTALLLRLVQRRINGEATAARNYAAACAVGAVGILILAHAPNVTVAAVGVLVVGGMSLTVLRLMGSIWVNRRTSSEVRATVHSFLAQAEYLGEIVIGFALALLARTTTVSVALTAAALVMAATCALVILRSTETASVS